MPKNRYENPLLEIYKGKKIYTYNQIVLRISPEAFKSIIDGQEETGLSKVQLLSHSSRPCDHCRNTSVTTLNADMKPVTVKRGILFNSIKTRYGAYNKKKK